MIDRLRGALKPFAEFGAVPSGPPDQFIITAGSTMARRQLTIGHCRDAALALMETGIRV